MFIPDLNESLSDLIKVLLEDYVWGECDKQIPSALNLTFIKRDFVSLDLADSNEVVWGLFMLQDMHHGEKWGIILKRCSLDWVVKLTEITV